MALGAALGAAAGVSALSSIVGTGLAIKGNEDALKAQQRAAELELKQAKQRAKLEDLLAVKSIELADRQATARFGQAEGQAAVAAAEDRLALESELATAKVNAATRATAIRRNLMATLGEQRATLAARGVASGSLPGMFQDEAESAALDDTQANRLNIMQTEADTAAGLRGIDTSLGNIRSSNALTLQQQRETAQRELTNARRTSKMELRQQGEVAKLGIQSAKQQTRYANIGALISGFSQIASLGYSAFSQYRAIEPSGGVQLRQQPSAYSSVRPIARYTSLAQRGV